MDITNTTKESENGLPEKVLNSAAKHVEKQHFMGIGLLASHTEPSVSKNG